MFQSAKKLIKEADSSRLRGDEERSFVLYMKYFGIIEAVRKHPEYIKNKQYYTGLFQSQVSYSMAMDQTEKLSKSLEKRYMQLSVVVDPEETDTSSDNDKSDSVTNNYSKTSITCEDLFEMIQRQNILILDCRPRDDFLLSSFRYSYCMNVPESMCVKG